MGKISEYLIELAEMITDWVEEYGFTVTQIHDRLKNELTEDEYRFFQAHDDIIFDMVSDEVGPLSEDYDQYELGPGDGAITSFAKRKEIEWPEEMRDEEEWDEDDDVPYPGGLTQDDYDLDYNNDPDEYMMESLGDFFRR